jgi:KaiC/GvpD/RAD55 family RecA-like ATPase
MYDLSDTLETDAVSEVRPGTSILLSGPAMTGKEQLAYDILADGSRNDEGALVVSTSDQADGIIQNYRQLVPEVQHPKLGVVDCRTDGSSDSETVDGYYVHHVSSPADLTGIGIGITKCLESLHGSGAETGRMALVSLSTMLTYTDRETVFKFCHVLSSRLDAAGYLGVFTIDSGAHEEQTLQVIKQAFDGLIELRESEGTRQVRVRGLTDSPTTWAAL